MFFIEYELVGKIMRSRFREKLNDKKLFSFFEYLLERRIFTLTIDPILPRKYLIASEYFIPAKEFPLAWVIISPLFIPAFKAGVS